MQLEHTVRQQQEWMDHLLAAGQEEEALHEQKIQDLQLQHARNVEKMEKGRRVVKELEEARLQLKTSQAEVTTLKEECVEAKRRVQELLHFKEALLCTRNTLNELEVLLTTREEAKRKEYECQELKVLLTTREEEAKKKEYEHMQEKEAFTQEILALREDSARVHVVDNVFVKRIGVPFHFCITPSDGLVKEVTETVMKAR
eukprot:Em0008g1277a